MDSRKTTVVIDFVGTPDQNRKRKTQDPTVAAARYNLAYKQQKTTHLSFPKLNKKVAIAPMMMQHNGVVDIFALSMVYTPDLEVTRTTAFNPATLGVRDVLEPYITPDLRVVDAWRN